VRVVDLADPAPGGQRSAGAPAAAASAASSAASAADRPARASTLP
jgi:hypothetical protein